MASRCPTGLSYFPSIFCRRQLVIFRAKKEDCEAVLEVLDSYERASGQHINFEKSGLWFSRNTSHGAKLFTHGILKIDRVITDDAYSRLPLSFGRNKGSQFQSIVQRVHCRIQNWNNRNLSMAGREVMLKSVA